VSRQVSATITEPTGTPREGLAVFFHAPDGYSPVVAMTDASGVFVADLETDITYRVSVENAVIIDGQSFPAGTVFVVLATAGEGTATATEVMQATIDASRPALLDAIDVLTARVVALEAAAVPPETPEGGA
jgi:hypothetical protein